MPHFFEFGAPDEFLQLCEAILAANQNDFVNAICTLESLKRVNYNRFISQQREQFIETHSLAAAGGDNDGAQHRTILQSLE